MRGGCNARKVLSSLVNILFGRIAGPAWIILGLLIYSLYRRHRKLPITKPLKRDWEKEHLLVYEDAGEHELADEYRENLARKRRLHHDQRQERRLPIDTQVLDVPIQAHSNNEKRRKRKED